MRILSVSAVAMMLSNSSYAQTLYEGACVCVSKKGGFIQKTLSETLGSKEGQIILKGACTYFTSDAANCSKVISTAGAIVNSVVKRNGGATYGQILPKRGYEMCRAWYASNGWSATSDSDASMRIRPDKITWLTTLGGSNRQGRWNKYTIIIEQVPVGTGNTHACWASIDGKGRGTLLWETNDRNFKARHEGVYIKFPSNVIKSFRCTEIC